jgi:hypothetical protein
MEGEFSILNFQFSMKRENNRTRNKEQMNEEVGEVHGRWTEFSIFNPEASGSIFDEEREQ